MQAALDGWADHNLETFLEGWHRPGLPMAKSGTASACTACWSAASMMQGQAECMPLLVGR